MKIIPDYSTYSYEDLVDAVNHINREKYPERYEEITQRISDIKNTINNQPEVTNDLPSEIENRFEFIGKTGEFFSIWTVNVLLTIVTLGIYSAWAKVRTQTYFYGNTLLDGSSFRYHAKPLQILRGRIIAFILFIAYYFSGYINLTVAGITIAAIALLMPAFIVMSTAFRLRNSSYRSVRYNFNKDYKKAYLIFSVPFILVASYVYLIIELQQNMDVQTELSSMNYIQFMLLPLVIGLLYPLFEYYLVRFRVNHSSFGLSPFEFKSGAGSFYAIYIIAGLVFFLGMIAVTFSMGKITSSFFVTASDEVSNSPEYFVYLFMIPMMALYLWFFAYIQTKRTNLIYSNAHIKGNQLKSNLSVSHMVYLYFTNTIAIAFSLGLLAPWAIIRTKRYKASCTSVISQHELGDFVAAQDKEQSAYGEEIGEMFDMDLGF